MKGVRHSQKARSARRSKTAQRSARATVSTPHESSVGQSAALRVRQLLRARIRPRNDEPNAWQAAEGLTAACEVAAKRTSARCDALLQRQAALSAA